MKETYEDRFGMTIERRLKLYSEAENHIERHEIMWHEWNHNKQWLENVQELILPSFISYSRHGASHSETVLRNIEMILGYENIMALSPTDCFCLLHTTYIHDIGMCITHGDRKKMLSDEKFHEFLENLAKSEHGDMATYAKYLLDQCVHPPKDISEKKKIDYILETKLNIYYGITYLMAEYRRKEHGEVSKKQLQHWIDEPTKLGAGFSTMEIPHRIFYSVAECAETHTIWDFNAVLNLPQEDTGYASDYFHPRFIAVLLQLGDVLDMDNSRFHPLVNEYLGEMPEMSKSHFLKHKAIRRLLITNEYISIKADCSSQGELRLVRQECDSIQGILEKASYYWSIIKPPSLKISIPTLKNVEILLNGKPIPSKFVTAKFEIPQNRAFQLLQGNNFYQINRFVFLRELLQNAVDASKIQMFNDFCRCGSNTDEKINPKKISPWEIREYISPLSYPITIELHIVKQERSLISDFRKEDLGKKSEEREGIRYGVQVKIKDCGTGIKADDIEKIIEVGSSYEKRKELIDGMPQWLQPTGTFGIGLQSVFLTCEKLFATTYTRNQEGYQITFESRSENKEGYINVIPWEVDNLTPYGSCFEMFVPNEVGICTPEEYEQVVDKDDPFSEDYKFTENLRQARNLVRKMALYLKKVVGEPLFPVCLKIYDPLLNDRSKDSQYLELLNKNLENIYLELYRYNQSEKKWEQINKAAKKKKDRIAWAYDFSSKRLTWKDKGNLYWLDEDAAKLYIWNCKYNVYSRIGINRIMSMRERLKKSRDFNESICEKLPVYYKGILLTEKEFRNDSNLIEYIDLKETLNRDYLKLNRNGLSEEGEARLELIYKEIIECAQEALIHFVENEFEKRGNRNILIENVKSMIEQCKSVSGEKEKISVDMIDRYILSIIAFTYFASVKKKKHIYTKGKKKEAGNWNDTLCEIKMYIDSHKGEDNLFYKYIKTAFFYNIPVSILEKDGSCSNTGQKTDLLTIMNSHNKYGILSEKENGIWKSILIQFDKDLYDSHIQIQLEMSDGTLWEGQTALYFRWIYLPDCAVPELAAGSRRDDRKLS